MAKGFEGDQLAGVRDGDRSSGEGVLGDGVAEDGEGGGKNFVLMVEGRKKSWSEVGQGLDAR